MSGSLVMKHTTSLKQFKVGQLDCDFVTLKAFVRYMELATEPRSAKWAPHVTTGEEIGRESDFKRRFGGETLYCEHIDIEARCKALTSPGW
jgi:hypothetical protein